MNTAHHPRLHIALWGAAIMAFCMALIVLTFPIRNRVADFEDDARLELVERSGNALRLVTSRMIEREWESLNGFVQEAEMTDVANLRAFTDAVVRASKAISWAGVADLNGRIVAGTAGLREGQDVSMRRWYLHGLEGGAVGSVYTPDGTAQEDRDTGFINLSKPITNEYGDSLGVVVYRLRVSWLRGIMTDMAQDLEIDFVVADRTGKVLFRERNQFEDPFPDSVVDLAATGTQLTQLFDEDDAVPFIVGVFPDLLSGEMPAFDWDLLVRIPSAHHSSNLGTFVSVVNWAIAGLFFVITIMANIYGMHFIRPIEKLVKDAERISQGEAVYPTEDVSSRESAILSTALAKIQTRLDSVRS